MPKINVVITDDQQIVREGIAELLSRFQDINLIFSASNGKDLLDQLETSNQNPDVIIMDVQMPIMNGFTASLEVVKNYPECKILYLTSHTSKIFIENAIQHHASGFLSKDDDASNLQKAIVTVHENGIYYNEFLNVDILRSVFDKQGKGQNELTNKEFEVIKYICQQKEIKEIAKLMDIRFDSVYKYIKSIKTKIGAENQVGIVIYAIQNGFI